MVMQLKKYDLFSAKVINQEFTTSNKGDPQLRLQGKLLAKYKNADKPSSGLDPLEEADQWTRTVFITFSNASMGDSLADLYAYGFEGTNLVALHPEAPEEIRFSLVGQTVQLKVDLSPDNKNPGQMRDWWHLTKRTDRAEKKATKVLSLADLMVFQKQNAEAIQAAVEPAAQNATEDIPY